MNIEKAKISDVIQMQKLINRFAGQGKMLARSLTELYENIRDYFIAKDGDDLIACAALHINWSDLAEIKALAVTENNQNKAGTITTPPPNPNKPANKPATAPKSILNKNSSSIVLSC